MEMELYILLSSLLILVAGTGDYDYGQVLKYSMLFYEAQRSGQLPTGNRIPWRGDSAVADKGQNGEDLSGGFYDAGDFVKFGFTMANTATMLSWGLLTYKDAYLATGQYEYCQDLARWAGDYFIKCHISPNELYGQVGDFSLDHSFWGRPEDLNMSRPAYKIDPEHPGSDLAGETAAALASISVVFQSVDPKYAASCLKHAQQLYHFAVTYRGLFHEAIKGAAQYYQSFDYGDELAWAAAWLYRASRDKKYLREAEKHYAEYKLYERPNEFYYNKKDVGVQVLLAELTLEEKYIAAAESFCDFNIIRPKTPLGLIYIEKFGTLCHAANIAFICLQVANFNRSSSVKHMNLAASQIHYMLGDSGRSFVVGFGKKYPLQPHHAASSCKSRPAPCNWEAFTSEGPNPKILYGALVSGPDKNDYFEDKRAEYIYTEVTLDCNTGLHNSAAALLHWKLKQK